MDNEWGKIVEFHKDPADLRGGVRLVVTVNHMLEGFRRGRYVRVFPDAWPLRDQPFGEQLFHYGARSFPTELAECSAKEYPEQYPFRTDHGNAHLPWYRAESPASRRRRIRNTGSSANSWRSVPTVAPAGFGSTTLPPKSSSV